MDFMEMQDIVKVVNGKLKDGLSTAQIEKQMKLGKDTLRKRLNRANYRYNKDLNQYILTDNTPITDNVITLKNTPATHSNNTYVTGNVITRNVTEVTQEVKEVTQQKAELTEDEIKILKIIASNYKKAESNYNFDGDVITRSIRTYKNVLEQFATYCKDNNLSQKESIAIALMDFMAK